MTSPFFDRDVRPEVAVDAGSGLCSRLEARPRGAVRALGINRRAGRSLDPRRVRRVVAMGVGDQDVRHGLAAHGIQQRLRRARLVVGAGIDDRDLAPAYDVADRAGEGEGARIVAQNAPHAGTGFLDHAGLQRKVAVERDVVVIGQWGLPAPCSSARHTTKAGIPAYAGGSRLNEAPLECWIARLADDDSYK